jgi:hypothetical protein
MEKVEKMKAIENLLSGYMTTVDADIASAKPTEIMRGSFLPRFEVVRLIGAIAEIV